MLTSRAGICCNQRCGEEYDLPPREALMLIAAGQAQAVEPETAACSEPETAATRITPPTTRKERRNERTIH